MDDLALLIDLHKNSARQGPGDAESTRLAITLSGLEKTRDLRIADIGCGTGAAALLLAHELNARVTAVDFVPDFLNRLENKAGNEGLADRVETLNASMDALPFDDDTFDAIWSEGAVYNIGFKNGISSWRRFLKPGGILAVSELVWLTDERPKELEDYWKEQYPEVDTAGAKMTALEENGYAPLGYFPLPEKCWRENYYQPLEAGFEDFITRNRDSDQARALVASEKEEIAFYDRFSAFYGYGYFIAAKTAD